MSIEAGTELLRGLGCHGSAAELAKTVEEVKGHALTLNLLGGFLRDVNGGDIRRRDLVDLSEADELSEDPHAFRVMRAYEIWFESEGENGRRQLAILRLLGLFDRPASAACLAALRREPAIAGLTEPLAGMKDSTWKVSLKRLADAGLIETGDAAVDAHPLLREYFASRLQAQSKAWQEAHGRLFDFLRLNTEFQPDTLAGLQPLYQAVYHGCQARRQQDACIEIYFNRINRGQEFYSTKTLGAYGADLGAVACFFAEPWSRVSSSLSRSEQCWLLNAAAFHLRALGRLREALEPLRAGLEGDVHRKDWENASISAHNLSELELMLGELAAAVADGESAVTFANQGGGAVRLKHSNLADAKHQQGEEEESQILFRASERQQAERQPQHPLLYSLPGFQFCDLLLVRAERAAGNGQWSNAADRDKECAEVESRATQTLAWVVRQLGSLDIALDHLTLGRARLYRAILARSFAPTVIEAANEIEKAVTGLRAAGRLDYLPLGLLTRAWLRSIQGNPEGAQTDLDEAKEIAERGEMRLHLADVALMRARLFDDREALVRAKQLVEECGYGRRRAEIADLEAKFRSQETGLGTGPRPSPG